MHRVVAFGCSQTFGHGLPDCIDPNNNNEQPSKFAWPALLQGINCAVPGGSNKLAIYKALNFNWRTNDVAVFVWTYINRSCIVETDIVNL